MKRRLFILSLIAFAGLNASAASLITNGSFEDDGFISNIKTDPPYGWDVNMSSKFGGEVGTSWKTDGLYGLKIYSAGFGTVFTAGDNGTVFQVVDLTDANEIIFDIRLKSYYGNWDGSKCTAFIKLDNSPNDLWKSGLADNGIYYNVSVPLDSNFTGVHTLYFGIRVDVSETFFNSFWVYWDSVRFDAFCGGYGYLEADLNHDCYVNFGDVDVLARNWLKADLVPADDLIDVWPDGAIDLFDFAVLADQWMLCSDWQNLNCIELPLDLSADINLDGIVNMPDYNILTANWGSPMDLKADIDGSGTVDYKDLAIMKAQWLEKSWLYKY